MTRYEEATKKAKQLAKAISQGMHLNHALVEAIYFGLDKELLAESIAKCESKEEVVKTLEQFSVSDMHAPCRCGGFDEEEVCSNTCMCGWRFVKEIIR